MPTTQENPVASPIGRNTPRVDGPLKVSGKAQYASDFHFPGLLYGVPVEATIANGKVTRLDTAAAEKMPGVREKRRKPLCRRSCVKTGSRADDATGRGDLLQPAVRGLGEDDDPIVAPGPTARLGGIRERRRGTACNVHLLQLAGSEKAD